MKISDVYDRCWKDKKLTSFEAYDRNLVLTKLFDKSKTGQMVLDLGCGDGAVSKWFQDKGCQVTAADFNDHAVISAKSRGVLNVTLLDLEKPLPFLDNTFDIVFWGDVIEHLFDPEAVIKEIYRVLKPGCKFVLSCPNVGYLGSRLKFLMTGSIRSVELAGQEPWEQEHIRFFNASDLNMFLIKNNFVIRKRFGVNRLWHSKLLVKIFPTLFGYIQIVEAIKK